MAADYELTVSIEDMQASAADFSRDISDMQSVVESLRAAVSRLEQSWEGEAMNQFLARFDALAMDLDNASKPMRDAVHRLLQAGDAFQQSEKAIGSGSDLGTVNPYIL